MAFNFDYIESHNRLINDINTKIEELMVTKPVPCNVFRTENVSLELLQDKESGLFTGLAHIKINSQPYFNVDLGYLAQLCAIMNNIFGPQPKIPVIGEIKHAISLPVSTDR